MPRLYLDTIAGSDAEAALLNDRISRGFVVAAIDVSSPAEALVRSLGVPGMPARGSILSPNLPEYTLRRYALRAYRNKIVAGRLIYEKAPLNTPPETFFAEDTTTLASNTTQLLPSTLEVLRVSFGSTATSDDLDAGETATLSYPDALRSLVMSGLFSTPPDLALQAAIRSVNSDNWMGLPRGYWWYNGIRVAWSNSDNKYRVTVTCTTKTEVDWSSYAATRNPADGKFVSVPLAETNGLRQQQYEQGIRYQKYGLLKAGLFRPVNFRNLFGPIVDRMP